MDVATHTKCWFTIFLHFQTRVEREKEIVAHSFAKFTKIWLAKWIFFPGTIDFNELQRNENCFMLVAVSIVAFAIVVFDVHSCFNFWRHFIHFLCSYGKLCFSMGGFCWCNFYRPYFRHCSPHQNWCQFQWKLLSSINRTLFWSFNAKFPPNINGNFAYDFGMRKRTGKNRKKRNWNVTNLNFFYKHCRL